MRKLSVDIFSIIIPVLLSLFSLAQNTLTVLELESSFSEINHLTSNFHEGVKPYINDELKIHLNLDSILESKTQLFKNEKFSKKNTKFLVLPLLNAGLGIEKNSSNNTIYDSHVGAQVNYQHKNKLSVSTFYQAGISKYPSYIKNYIAKSCVVPQEGIGFIKNNNIHSRNFGGYLSYSPNEIFNFELGHGKHHWGNGYRSLLLSDASNNYSYAKIATTIWKFKYVNLYTNFKNIGNEVQTPFWKQENKFGTFHYLSWNVSKRINLSFFETVVWQAKDTLVNRGFDVNYLNPVIFYRPIEYSIGSSDNSLIGLNVRYKVSNNILLYGQLIMDEFLLSAVRSDFVVKAKQTLGKDVDPNTQYGWWANKQGFQIGGKWNNFLKIKNLNTIIEYNTVRPYTYSHISGLSNYGHYNQSLAHPYGANFKELIWILNYQKDHVNITLKNIYTIRGLDNETSNFGSDIFKPYITREQEYYNYTGQGFTSKMIFIDLKASYIFSPKNMLHAFVGIRNRSENLITGNTNALFFYLGIKTSLYNTFNEF